ncbi:hypothetical protein CAPTEDRAFT_211200 [Capitella teleta]|uniref:HTH psq-type domain-containing protein n=1 Tax=Capitella teleta TaxID=283909 RepID=R7T445_CAPTE|nr:hypothetical protein CAPTEDRAFT_211200 [Capitella teleta]|eukprot:ELT87652.1 hypothetical protein CAPTEDRAFT_211200 [Capitella teleta]
MKAAVAMVLEGADSIRNVAKDTGIAKSTLQRYVNKAKHAQSTDIRLKPAYDNKLVFTNDEEKDLSKYLLTASKRNHGLTTCSTRKLAYEYAVRNKKNIPSSWTHKGLDDNRLVEGATHRHLHQARSPVGRLHLLGENFELLYY